MMRGLVLLLLLHAAAAAAEPPDRTCSSGRLGPVMCIRAAHFAFDTCQALAVFGRSQRLDPAFFARLIWQESRFDPNATSPAGAQGIAQFMPATARRRGLRDPFNPALALEHAAAYLAELAARYGNVGLAAVAYNGGEARAEGLIAGSGGIARETIDYVTTITGRSHRDWLAADMPPPDLRLSKEIPFEAACHVLARKRRLSPLVSVAQAIRPWGAQLAFGTTRGKAMAKFRSRARRCAAIVKGERPDLVFERSRASPRGGYWMARLGRNSRDAAQKLCRELRRSGCGCAVYRNRG